MNAIVLTALMWSIVVDSMAMDRVLFRWHDLILNVTIHIYVKSFKSIMYMMYIYVKISVSLLKFCFICMRK